METKKKILIVEIISALYVLLFVYAAISKFVDFQKFKIELGKSPILSAYAGLIAITIPLIEIVLAILLVFRIKQYYVLYMSFSLMVIFTAYIVVILQFSPYIPCSCGGIIQNMTWNQHLIFNITFLLMDIVAILLYPELNKELTRDKKGSLHP